MSGPRSHRHATVGVAARYALGVIQGIMGLFAAGAVIYEAHSLFLWYYAREWQGIQLSGVNGCAGEDMVANGDLFNGKTFCNKPENLVPWVEIYRHHPLVAAAYYGGLLAIVGLIALVWMLAQRRSRPPDPTTQTPHGSTSGHDTI